MHVQKHHVGSRGLRRQRQPADILARCGRCRRTDHYRQVRQALEKRNRREIQRIPARCFKRPYPPLAENHLLVSLAEDEFRRTEELFQRSGGIADQHHGAVHPAGLLKQREVLHVHRADLKDISLLGRLEHILREEHLRHDRQFKILSGAGEVIQPFKAEALEALLRGTGGKAPPIEDMRPALLDIPGADADMILIFDCGGTGGDHQGASADHNPLDIEKRALSLVGSGDKPVSRFNMQDGCRSAPGFMVLSLLFFMCNKINNRRRGFFAVKGGVGAEHAEKGALTSELLKRFLRIVMLKVALEIDIEEIFEGVARPGAAFKLRHAEMTLRQFIEAAGESAFVMGG